MALDENTVRLAKGKNLATVVTLMPNGQPQLSRRYVGTEYSAPIGPEGRVIFKIVPDKVNTAKS